MTIKAVKDPSGKVIATFEQGQGGTIAPVLPAGHTVVDLEVAANYRDDLKTFYSTAGK